MIQNIPESIKDTLHSIIKSQNIIEVPAIINTSTEIVDTQTKLNNEIIIPVYPEPIQSESSQVDHKELGKVLDASKLNNSEIPKSMKLIRNILHKGDNVKPNVVLSGIEMEKKENK
jgi:hypothetical protein